MASWAGGHAGPVVVGLVLLAVVGNHTFLQWCTSGLETSLFNLLFVAWVAMPFAWRERPRARSLAAWAALAALTTLTRPDGLLLCAATVAVVLWDLLHRRLTLRAFVAAASPLLIVAAQIAWRRSFYGEWLPNTYYAKVTAPWPEAGWRYLQCFVFEHGTWILLPVLAVWLGTWHRHRAGRSPTSMAALAAITTVVAHASYYVLRVGGDHFAYRVLSHLVPLTALAVAALSLRVGRAACATSLVALSFASGIEWLPVTLTNQRVPPAYDAFADHVPDWAAPIARWYDRRRLWLRLQMVCIDFRPSAPVESVLALAPERRRRQPERDDVLVATASAAGLIGWALPDIAILDVLGLNDWVTARTAVDPGGQSLIPPDAIAALLANADIDGSGTRTRAELIDALRPLSGNATRAGQLAELMLTLFAVESSDSLTDAETDMVAPYFRGLRLMAHERRAPPEYIDAFDVNVTFDGPELTIRERERPLTRDDVRAIERRWRAKLGG